MGSEKSRGNGLWVRHEIFSIPIRFFVSRAAKCTIGSATLTRFRAVRHEMHDWISPSSSSGTQRGRDMSRTERKRALPVIMLSNASFACERE